MTKIRFDNLTLGNFTFNFASIKKKVESRKITSKLVRGLCFKEGDNFKISLDIKTLKPDLIDDKYPDILILDFTEESYEIKGRNVVFSREPDKNGKHIRYIRNDLKSKFHPGSQERYVPFCRNWICSGHIVKRNGNLMFDFNECIAPKGYDVFIPDED